MPLVNFYLTDPGLEIRQATTQINIIEKLAKAARSARGRGSVVYVAAMVNDRGLSNDPQLVASMSEIEELWGGFAPWLGDGLAGGTEANGFDERGAAAGYNGNGYAMVYGLNAPIVSFCVPNMETRKSGVSVPIVLTRAAGSGPYTVKAGTRIKVTAGGYMVATLEDATWTEAAPNSAKSVRVRSVGGTEAAIDTVDLFYDTVDSTVTVTTSAVDVPDAMDAAEVAVRYLSALNTINSNAFGQISEFVVCDRTEDDINDDVADHAAASTAEGLFRIAFTGQAIGVTAANAITAVASLTSDTYAVATHPGVQRQFRTDKDNLSSANGFTTTMPAHVVACFLAAQWRPEENPARHHKILEDYRIVGVEALAVKPDRATHEAAGIWQPVLEHVFGGFGMVASFHASPMADGTTKFATRRMAFFLYKNFLALSLPYHKALASRTNRDGLLGAIAAFLERLATDERIASYAEPTGDWTSPEFTVSVAVEEVGNLDVMTFRPTFGPTAVQDAQ